MTGLRRTKPDQPDRALAIDCIGLGARLYAGGRLEAEIEEAEAALRVLESPLDHVGDNTVA
jgi:hypothetical protein